MSPLQVAVRLGVSRSTAYRLIADGDLIATRIRGQWRVSEAALSDYIASHTNVLRVA